MWMRAPAGWTRAYEVAVDPLAAKGVLLVTSAGNEAIDLDRLDQLGYSYSPCLIKVRAEGVLATHTRRPASSRI